jgi:hypothetical protein
VVAKFLLLLEVVALFEECRRLNSQVSRYGPAQLGKTFLNQNCILTTCSAGDGLGVVCREAGVGRREGCLDNCEK